MDDYVKRRLAELYAAAPAKRKKTAPFAMLELNAAAKAFKAAKCPKAMVWVWLLHQMWKTGENIIPLPNDALTKYGVDRKTKYLVLRQYAAAGLITVKWPPRKTPVVTLL
jgi:hypothetical protein